MTKDQQEKLEARLDNWGRWSRSSDEPVGRCGSIEGRHVAERDPDDTHIQHLAQAPIDRIDALLIEKAVGSLRIARARLLLKREYVQRRDKLAQARWLNVAPMLVRPAVLMALGALQARLDRMFDDERGVSRMRRGLHSPQSPSTVAALSDAVDPASKQSRACVKT